jgi:hypothetical protein
MDNFTRRRMKRAAIILNGRPEQLFYLMWFSKIKHFGLRRQINEMGSAVKNHV